MVRVMKKEKLVAGFGTDGDADRFGVVDQDGTLLSPNEILPIVLQHLVETPQDEGSRRAQRHDLEIHRRGRQTLRSRTQGNTRRF